MASKQFTKPKCQPYNIIKMRCRFMYFLVLVQYHTEAEDGCRRRFLRKIQNN